MDCQHDKRIVKSDDVHTCSYHDDDDVDERERERGNFQLLAAAHQPTTSPMHPVPVLCVVVAHVPDVIEQQAYWVT